MKAETEFDRVWVKVKSVMGGKVDKVKGKGLSTNDYSTDDKQKVDNAIPILNYEIDLLFSERGK